MSKRTVMQHQFSKIPDATIPRAEFDMSSSLTTAFDTGYIIPIYCLDVIPGDTINMKMSAFARLATPIYPVFTPMYMDVHWFFVPLRIIWTNFVKMMGEQTDPGDSIDYTVPTMTAPGAGGHAEESLSDYLGIPTKINSLVHSTLFHRTYAKIFNDWFRDQNLIDSVTLDIDDGPDTSTDYTIQKRGKRYDYFTQALTAPQKGDGVDLPLGSTAPIDYVTGSTALLRLSGGGLSGAENLIVDASGNLEQGTSAGHLFLDPNGSLEADLSSANSVTVNQLREAIQIQKLLERDARGGTRYVELVRSHFGIRNAGGDARMQRAEFLGSATAKININPVAQTSETNTTPQGNLSAIGTSVINLGGFKSSFTEHGICMAVASIRADLVYQQGLDRMFSRSTRYDFFWPSLAMIGEESLLNKELYAQADANDDLTFGYVPRYDAYRFKTSKVTGKMRSNATTSLDAWHLALEFSSLPTLGQTFIEEAPPVDRIVAVTSEPEILLDAYFDTKAARPMPLFGVPGMMDHF